MDTIKRPNAALVEFWEEVLEADTWAMDPGDSEDAAQRAESWDACAVAALAPWASAVCHLTTALIFEAQRAKVLSRRAEGKDFGRSYLTREERLAIVTRPEAKHLAEYFELGCSFELAWFDVDLAISECDTEGANEAINRAAVIFSEIRTLAKAEYTD